MAVVAKSTGSRPLIYLQAGHFWLNGAAQGSNLPSVGLPHLTGFEPSTEAGRTTEGSGFGARFPPRRCAQVSQDGERRRVPSSPMLGLRVVYRARVSAAPRPEVNSLEEHGRNRR